MPLAVVSVERDATDFFVTVDAGRRQRYIDRAAKIALVVVVVVGDREQQTVGVSRRVRIDAGPRRSAGVRVLLLLLMMRGT